MAITQARADTLSNILSKDVEQGKKLLALAPEEALEQINGGLGYDFTLDELKAFGQAAINSLGDDVLEGVSGGVGSFARPVAPLPVVTLPGIIPLPGQISAPGIMPLPGTVDVPITTLPGVINWK